MNKTYSKVIAILVIMVALLSIALFNKNNDENLVQRTNISREDNTNNNQDNMNNENRDENRVVIEKIEKENGLVIEVLQKGDGSVAENGKLVSVHYTGLLEDGTIFDSSVQRGTPIEFQLGSGQVIRGWEEGVLGMLVGEKRILTIPSDLAYGPAGITAPDGTVVIPGGATLIFDVELVAVN